TPPGGTGLGPISEDAIEATLNINDMLAISGLITDADSGAVKGMAITGAVGNGFMEFSTDDGTSWNPVDIATLSETSALLLRQTDGLRYTPDGENGEAASLTAHAWDQTGTTAGQQGTRVDITSIGTGGSSPFSSTTVTAELTVNDINDAPVLNTAAVDMGGTINPIQGSVSNLLIQPNGQSALNITDVDVPHSKGVAITGFTGMGTLMYDIGNGFQVFNNPSLANSALLLREGDLLRYEPLVGSDSDFITINFRAWDQTGATAGQQGTYYVTTNQLGGTHPFSMGEAVATLQIASEAIFSISDSRAIEHDGFAFVTVERSGDTSSTAWVRYDTYEKNARLSGDYNDYKPTHGWLTFAAGETVKHLQIPIIDDAIDEGLQHFEVRLAWAGSDGTGGAVLAQGADRATVYITDNDEPSTAEQSALIFGTNGADTLAGSAASETILGQDGNDTLTSSGDDMLIGGNGDDRLVIGNGKTMVVLAPNTGLDTLVIANDFSGKLGLDMSAFGIDVGVPGEFEFVDVGGAYGSTDPDRNNLSTEEGLVLGTGQYANAGAALKAGIMAIDGVVGAPSTTGGVIYIPLSATRIVAWEGTDGQVRLSSVTYHITPPPQDGIPVGPVPRQTGASLEGAIAIDASEDILLFEGRNFTSLENLNMGFFTGLMTGTSADEVLTGSVTDDVITSGGGVDYITGGLGSDTLVIGPNLADETVMIYRPQDLLEGEIDRVVGLGPDAGSFLFDLSQFGIDNGTPLLTDMTFIYEGGSALPAGAQPDLADLIVYGSQGSFTTAADALASLQTTPGQLSDSFFMAWNKGGEMAVSFIEGGVAAGDLFIIDGYNYGEVLSIFESSLVYEANFNLVPLQVGSNTITEGPELSDHLQGDARSEILMGMAGRDLLEGGDGDDILIGDRMSLNGTQRFDAMNMINSGTYPDFSQFTFTGNGADSLWGGQGVDILIGGEGADGFGFRPEDLDNDPDWIIDFEAQRTYTDGSGYQHTTSNDYIDLTAFKVDNGESGRADIVYVDGLSPVDLSLADIVIDTSGSEYIDGVLALNDLTSNQTVTGADNEFFYVWQDLDLDVRLSYVEDFDHDGLFNPDEISDIAILTNLNPVPNSPFNMYTLDHNNFLISNIQAMTQQWIGGANKLGSNEITYNFAPNEVEFGTAGGSNIGVLNQTARDAITDALTLWTESNGLNFTLDETSPTADWSFGLGNNIEGWDVKTIHNNNGERDFWLSQKYFGLLTAEEWAPGASTAFYDLLSNIGHRLGIQQPQQYQDWENPPYIRPDLDDGSATVFNWDGSANWPTDAWTPMMLDHQAMQFLYGVDTTTRSGTTKYGYGARTNYTMGDFTSGDHLEYLNFTDTGPIPVGVIWDSGGEDALAWNPVDPTPTHIDLRPGHFSSMGGLTDNIGIAEGTIIERAGGGAGDDIIKGNGADNRLLGRDGDDKLMGLGGDDRIWGEGGDDILIGGAGLDRLWGGGGADTFVVGEPEVKDPNNSSLGWNSDRILDFSFAENDVIDIRDVLPDFDPTTDNILNFVEARARTYVDSTSGITQDYTQLRIDYEGNGPDPETGAWRSDAVIQIYFTTDGGTTFSGHTDVQQLIDNESLLY
ncbi:MAG: M10 family metallopeptidase C-terminal domain-containing protein, partial [Sedimenticola sp.]